MRKKRLEKIKDRLINIREDLLRETKQKNIEAADIMDEGVADVADQGLTDNIKEVLHLLIDNKREEIMKIDEALQRLNEGTYGICQNCGESIDIERLELRPYTRFCIECKKELEKEERIKAGPGKGLM